MEIEKNITTPWKVHFGYCCHVLKKSVTFRCRTSNLRTIDTFLVKRPLKMTSALKLYVFPTVWLKLLIYVFEIS